MSSYFNNWKIPCSSIDSIYLPIFTQALITEIIQIFQSTWIDCSFDCFFPPLYAWEIYFCSVKQIISDEFSIEYRATEIVYVIYVLLDYRIERYFVIVYYICSRALFRCFFVIRVNNLYLIYNLCRSSAYTQITIVLYIFFIFIDWSIEPPVWNNTFEMRIWVNLLAHSFALLCQWTT